MSDTYWNEKFTTNVEEIDNQHKQLFSLVSQIVGSLETFPDKQGLSAVFAEMIRYTEEHFTFEEEYLLRIGYPDFEEHKKEHTAFIKIVEDYQKRYQNGEIALSLRILDFLVTWLKNHILGSDLKYSHYAQTLSVN